MFVFVIKPALTAEVRPVSPGQELDGEIIIERGLRAGEQVVADGQLSLVPGVKVQIMPNTDSRVVKTP
jgi:multidrug efflux system membrane fusion protein